LRHNPANAEHYITVCAHNEHFLEYRQIVRDEIMAQLAEFQRQEALTSGKNRHSGLIIPRMGK